MKPILVKTEAPVRLSKYLSSIGFCSRREADDLIENGGVLIDGSPASLGVKVINGQTIEIKSSATKTLDKQLTIALNKPPGFVSATPEKGYTSALSLLRPENYQGEGKAPWLSLEQKNFAPAGRLDIESRGLLILTQDGRVAKVLTRSEFKIEKEYVVSVHQEVQSEQLKMLRHGLVLDDKPLLKAKVTAIRPNLLRFVLVEGRKRQIRRMCELVGLEVHLLKRVRIGKLRLDDLEEGKWRTVSIDQIVP